MKKQLSKIGLLAMMLFTVSAYAQTTEKPLSEEEKAAAIAQRKKQLEQEKAGFEKPYNPAENAEAKLKEILKQAKAEGKNVMIQAGGNWCIWCLRFNHYVKTTPELKNLVDANYVYYHLNYSPDNKNEKVFAKYLKPGEKYGYPFFIVLDSDGKKIHIQESGVLEKDKGYDFDKVKAFFEAWTPNKG